jgi:hypothetical protein
MFRLSRSAGATALLLPMTLASGAFADANLPQLYFTEDADPSTIRRMAPNGENVQTILTMTSYSPDGIDLDLAGGSMYWVEHTQNRIRRAGLDGQSPVTLLSTTTPRDIALDVAGGRMYYTAKTGSAHSDIRTAALDGTDERTLFTTSSWADGIALDLTHQKLYWSTFNSLQRSDLDGGNIETLFQRGNPYYGDVVVDQQHGKIYWSDVYRINRCNLDASSPEWFVIPSGNAVRLAYDPIDSKIVWTTSNGVWRADTSTFGAGIEEIFVHDGFKMGLAYVPEPGAATLAVAVMGLRLCRRALSAGSRMV